MSRLFLSVFVSLFSLSAWAMTIDPIDKRLNRDKPVSPMAVQADDENEFDPSAPDAMQTLQAFDEAYRAETGEDSQADFSNPYFGLTLQVGGCFRGDCHIFANVVKNERPQMLYLYIDGALTLAWKVSTAARGHTTPDFDGHPSGPFYSGKYTSRKYPEGDYHGLGNMPYAIFYHGGFAIHGTPSISRLGVPASHGCVRSHPDNAQFFSQLVRSTGSGGVWVTVSGSRVSPASSDLLSVR